MTEPIEWATDVQGVEMRWPDATDGPLVLRCHLAIVQERVALVGLDVRTFTEDSDGQRSPGPGGLRDIDYAAIRTLTVTDIATKAKVKAAMEAVSVAAEALGTVSSERLMETVGGRRKHKRGEAERVLRLTRVARLYELAEQAGGEVARQPAKFVQQRLADGGVTATAGQVRQWIYLARQEGLLAPKEPRGGQE